MSLYVLDASVAVKWYVEEEFSSQARRVLAGDDDLLAPSFTPNEVGSAFLKKVRRGEMRQDIAVQALPFVSHRLTLTSVTDLIGQALDFALEYDRSIFDSFYVLVALQEDCQMITADRRLFNSLASRFSDHMLWIEDFPAAQV